MKISIKTLQGKPTELDVNETDTLADVKKKISTQMNVDPASQKLIHYGKVMTDENKKLAEYGVKDKDFLVLMITKVFFLKCYT
jgi:UV excision repair protein RAD23